MLPEFPASLRLLPARLAEAMQHCNVVQLRRGATRAARLAIARAGLSDPRVDAALAALESGRTGDGPARDALVRLVEALDNTAWDIRARAGPHGPDVAEYRRAFRLARSANVLWSALDPDPALAAADAAYEAHAVVEDWDVLASLW